MLEDAPANPAAMAAMATMPQDLPMFKAGPMSLMPTAGLGNRPDILAADIPAGGKTSARAIARMYAAMLGEVDGTRLISPERLREATTVAMRGNDEVFGMPTTINNVETLACVGIEHSIDPEGLQRGGVFLREVLSGRPA